MIEIGITKAESKDNPFTDVITQFLWIIHIYGILNYIWYLQRFGGQLENLPNDVGATLSTISMEISKTIDKETEIYQKLYHPRLNQHNQQQELERKKRQQKEAQNQENEWKSEGSGLTKESLGQILGYENDNIAPTLTTRDAMKQMMKQLENLAKWASEMKRTPPVSNNNKAIQRHTEIQKAAIDYMTWYQTHYLVFYPMQPELMNNDNNNPIQPELFDFPIIPGNLMDSVKPPTQSLPSHQMINTNVVNNQQQKPPIIQPSPSNLGPSLNPPTIQPSPSSSRPNVINASSHLDPQFDYNQRPTHPSSIPSNMIRDPNHVYALL